MTSSAVLRGIGVSPGRVVAPVVRMPAPVTEPIPGSRIRVGRHPRAEAERVRDAAASVQADLSALADTVEYEAREVLTANAAIAADPALVDSVRERVLAGAAPERAVWDAAADIADMLAAAGGIPAERIRDLDDVRDRIIARLQGRPAPGVPAAAGPFVLVARDLAPADAATLDPARCVALVTEEGGPTSHTAILARALGLPAVVAVEGALSLNDDCMVLVDGAVGIVELDPSANTIAQVRSMQRESRTFQGKGRTSDGRAVALMANVGDAAGARAGAAAGAEGVGLFRTEFCFLGRERAPGVAEQVAAYRGVFAVFAGRRVVVRTLDAGADKPLPFLAATDEANPALGVRGVRTAVRHPQVLRDQLTAIAQAAAAEQADVWVMAPMISTAEEAERFATVAAAHGLNTAGVMVEVPAAALTAASVLAVCDFASIGTNDLTQYAMAADRMLSGVATLNDPWQPAALRLIELTCDAGASRKRPVGVCGEAAADPVLACVLVGLGVDSLSMAPRALADVGAVLAAVSSDTCAELARLALAAPSAEAARATVRQALSETSTVLADLDL